MNSIRIQQVNMLKLWSCSSKTTANGMPVILLKFFVHSSAKKPSGTSNQDPPTGDVNFLLKGEGEEKGLFALKKFSQQN